MLIKTQKKSSSYKKEDKVNIDYHIKNWKLIINLDYNLYKYELYWKDITLRLEYTAKVKKESPVSYSKVLHEEKLKIDWLKKTISIYLPRRKIYTYEWLDLDLNLNLNFKINDAFIFDTRVKKDIKSPLLNKGVVGKKTSLSNIDHFNFMDNFFALSNKRQNIIIYLFIFLMFILLISIIYIPIIIVEILFCFSIIFWVFYFIIKKMFLDFMSLNIKTINIVKEKIYKFSDFVNWKSKVDLKNATIRVIARNVEKWKHVTWSWKSRSTKTFKTYINNIILHEEKVKLIPKWEEINKYLKWEFSFDEMFEKLYPLNMLSSSYWVDVEWQVQVITNKYVDKKVTWENTFKYNDFI